VVGASAKRGLTPLENAADRCGADYPRVLLAKKNCWRHRVRFVARRSSGLQAAGVRLGAVANSGPAKHFRQLAQAVSKRFPAGGTGGLGDVWTLWGPCWGSTREYWEFPGEQSADPGKEGPGAPEHEGGDPKSDSAKRFRGIFLRKFLARKSAAAYGGVGWAQRNSCFRKGAHRQIFSDVGSAFENKQSGAWEDLVRYRVGGGGRACRSKNTFKDGGTLASRQATAWDAIDAGGGTVGDFLQAWPNFFVVGSLDRRVGAPPRIFILRRRTSASTL